MTRKMQIPSLLLLVAAVLLIPPFKSAAEDGQHAAKSKPNVKAWKKNFESGKKLRDSGRGNEAAAAFEAALKEAENFEDKDERLAETVFDYGDLFASYGDYPHAAPLLERAVTLLRLGKDSSHLMNALIDYGHVCIELKKMGPAETSIAEARGLMEKSALRKGHPVEGLLTLYEGQILSSKKEYEQAAKKMREAANMFETPPTQMRVTPGEPAAYGVQMTEFVGKDYPVQAMLALTNLCQAYEFMDQTDNAAKALKEVMGLSIPQSLKLLAQDRLAILYQVHGKYVEAAKEIKSMAQYYEKMAGANHTFTMHTYGRLAHIYELENKLSEAEELYKKILSDAEKKNPPDPQQVSSWKMSLAEFYQRQKRYDEAVAIYKAALDGERRRIGERIDLDIALSHLAQLYASLGRDDELPAIYQERIQIIAATFGAEHSALIPLLEQDAEVLKKLHRDAEAEPVEARLKAIREKNRK